jgi:predicted ATPase
MSETPAEDGIRVRNVPFINRVRLKNYKSIAQCDVRLGPLTILVGPNGSGKSNFLDALAFLARAVATTPAEAIDERGGLGEILRRVPEQAKSFSVAIDATVPWGPLPDQQVDATYEFEIGPPARRGLRSFEVIGEACSLRWQGKLWQFTADRGQVRIVEPDRRPGVANFEADRFYLPVASIQTTYAPLFGNLRLMQFYNFDVEALREPQQAAADIILGHTGEHLGDVLAALAADSRGYKPRIDAYMRAVVQDITAIEPYSAGGYVTVALRTGMGDGGNEVEFGPKSMSDGTIRAAAVLAALFQPPVLDGRVRLVGIEEPEIALHPAAVGVLFDALTEASEHVQVLATSQSADLLDRDDLDLSTVRPVTMRNGLTIIGEVDDASREIAEKKLYTLGELMRGNQLAPRPVPTGDLPRKKYEQRLDTDNYCIRRRGLRRSERAAEAVVPSSRGTWNASPHTQAAHAGTQVETDGASRDRECRERQSE